MKRFFAWYRQQRQRRLFSWSVDIAVVLAVVAVVGLWQTRGHIRGPSPLPASMMTLQGASLDLTSLRGKPVLLAFWAPWCGVCKGEASNLNWLNAHAGDRFHVVSVATAYDSLAEVQRFSTQNNVAFPVLLGDDELQAKFQIRAFPTVYFLDAEGNVKNSVVGYSTTVGLLARTLLP